MPWLSNSIHFKQIYAEGYRYLDKCGEFLLAARKEDFIPGEVKPSGGQITIPELRLHGLVGTTEITMRQDFPEEGFSTFGKKVGAVVHLAAKHFGPLDVQSNGIAGKWFFPTKNAEHAATLSLHFKSELQDDLSEKLGMSPAAAHVDMNFESGNTTLHVMIQPVAMETAPAKKHQLPLRATREQHSVVKRLNLGATEGHVGHGLLLDVDLVEFDPPTGTLENHFALFESQSNLLLNSFLTEK